MYVLPLIKPSGIDVYKLKSFLSNLVPHKIRALHIIIMDENY